MLISLHDLQVIVNKLILASKIALLFVFTSVHILTGGTAQDRLGFAAGEELPVSDVKLLLLHCFDLLQ